MKVSHDDAESGHFFWDHFFFPDLALCPPQTDGIATRALFYKQLKSCDAPTWIEPPPKVLGTCGPWPLIGFDISCQTPFCANIKRKPRCPTVTSTSASGISPRTRGRIRGIVSRSWSKRRRTSA